jgi:hypothetical protein
LPGDHVISLIIIFFGNNGGDLGFYGNIFTFFSGILGFGITFGFKGITYDNSSSSKLSAEGSLSDPELPPSSCPVVI